MANSLKTEWSANELTTAQCSIHLPCNVIIPFMLRGEITTG
jgi:hypothetical protein